MPETAEPQAGTEITPNASDTPPWTADDFDAERAWKKIQALEADKKKLAARPVLDDVAKQKLTEYALLEQASKTELERKAEEVTRWQSEAERWRTASVASRIESLASSDFADPSDAAAALPDPSKYLGVDGLIDDDAIRTDLAAVLEKKPHWRRPDPASSGHRLPAPNTAQGSGSGRPAINPAADFASIVQGQLRGS